MRTLYASIMMLVLGGIFIGCGSGSSAANNEANEITKKDTIEQPVMNFSLIELGNKVGNVELKPATNDVLKINYVKIVKNGTAELAAELFDKIAVTVRTEADTIYIETPGIENKDQIIAKYKDEIDIQKVNFSFNFILEAPAKLTKIKLGTGVGNIGAENFAGSFTLKSGTGDIFVKDLTGSLDLESGTGSIVLNDNINITGESKLKSGVGEISARLCTIEADATMNIGAQTGNINLFLRNSIKCTLKTHQFMKDDQTEMINGGGVIIEATSQMGKVNVRFFN